MSHSWPRRRLDERLGDVVQPVLERVPDTGDHEQPGDGRADGEHGDRDRHRAWALAVVGMLVVRRLGLRRGLAVEDAQVEPERVEAR